MCRHLELRNLGKIGMCVRIQLIGKQLHHARPTKLTWWQANCVNHGKVYDRLRRPRILIG